jgi:hypothetical protein
VAAPLQPAHQTALGRFDGYLQSSAALTEELNKRMLIAHPDKVGSEANPAFIL